MTSAKESVAFSGIPLAALDFYEDLEDDNSRAFWLANKDRYTAHVLEPLQALAAELSIEFGASKIFRPYRDVRFAKDKTPYKTQQGVWFPESHRYLQVSAEGLLVGGGEYAFSPDQLVRFRRAIDAQLPGDQLSTVIAACADAGLQLMGESLVRVPTGFAKDHRHQQLLRHKSIAVSQQLGAPDWLNDAGATPEISRRLRAMEPVVAWLAAHVGKAEESNRRR